MSLLFFPDNTVLVNFAYQKSVIRSFLPLLVFKARNGIN